MMKPERCSSGKRLSNGRDDRRGALAPNDDFCLSGRAFAIPAFLSLQSFFMRILVVNPNTTASMTLKIGAAARSLASSGVEIISANPEFGPPSIEGYYDEAFAIPGLIAEMEKAGDVDATVIACFDDTGLEAARSFSPKPVVGIGEAAFHFASLVAGKFSVVTTLSRSIAAIEHNLLKYGLASRCARVRACDVAVLELEAPGSNARAKIEQEIELALREDGADAIVLGCAGMADLASDLSNFAGAPVVEGVGCAVLLAESLARLGLRTSKVGGYAAPRSKEYRGSFKQFSPR
jgi:allantoin racemase